MSLCEWAPQFHLQHILFYTFSACFQWLPLYEDMNTWTFFDNKFVLNYKTKSRKSKTDNRISDFLLKLLNCYIQLTCILIIKLNLIKPLKWKAQNLRKNKMDFRKNKTHFIGSYKLLLIFFCGRWSERFSWGWSTQRRRNTPWRSPTTLITWSPVTQPCGPHSSSLRP